MCRRPKTGGFRSGTSYAAGNQDTGQIGTAAKRSITDADYAAGNRDTVYAGAIIERIIFNTFYAVGDGIASGLAPWALDKSCLARVVQDPICTAVYGI